MCCPSQTAHLTMSSARIDPPKRVLGLKEGVGTPPPIHGVSKITEAQQGLLSPLILPNPFPWIVIVTPAVYPRLVGFPLSVPVLSWLFDAREKLPKESFPVHPPADTRRSVRLKQPTNKAVHLGDLMRL
ncbi:unnamed protein product [Brassica napus]|uniref:(rape) hypothetical protein n=1 Tax=Brassica napus TaxID=3708 RepID=A0A816TA78_BRANA|nr:unnamed protein product [Brassica napus]